MAKESGIGANLYMDGYDISGDVGSVQQIAMPMGTLGVRGLPSRAEERIIGKADGLINYNAFWNTATGAAFDALKADLFTGADRHVMYCHRTTIGSPAAALVSKRAETSWERTAEGALTASFSAMANGYGLDWGELLTAGKRTDTSATNGSSLDYGSASTTFGAQFYLQVFSLTGTSVTVTIQDSADNSSFSAITGGAFTAATGRGAQRIETGRSQTIRRYVRVATTGTFTSAVIAVMMNRNLVNKVT